MNNKEGNILIGICALRNVIDIFFGPFLTAYFIKTSFTSLIDLSVYYIVNYFILATFGLIVGAFMRKHIQKHVFRLGVVLNFVYILSIVILKEKIINHIALVAFLHGISAILYHYPNNLFMAFKVKNKDRANWEFRKNTTCNILSVAIPLVLGGIISTSSFELTSVIILFVSLTQMILSFFLTPIDDIDFNFTPFKAFKEFINDKDVYNMLKVDFLSGMNLNGALSGILITILIFNAFKTDMNLGIFSSLSSLLSIAMQYVYSKYLAHKDDRLTIGICALVPVLSLLLLLIMNNNLSLIIYYFCYSGFVSVLSLTINIRLNNISHGKVISNNLQTEFWSIREFILGLGRMFSFALVLLVGLVGEQLYLNYLLVILTLTIVLMGYILGLVGNYEEYE